MEVYEKENQDFFKKLINDLKVEEIKISVFDNEIVKLLKNTPTKTTALDLNSLDIDDKIQIIEK